ncbi:probable inactive shikimate kinase like 2, chloroplastic [Vigna umbellata]|uniref:probable inactive shikimate kinase like 2, chloroplastic n=1 Tax=Vigna umbellata TaxID=87088 RepID=UPI001F5EDE60|nr:probable inactive shikimate kinase like 2, chloroplastic [Vigna umbellata]
MAVAPLRLRYLFPNHTNLNFSLFKPNVLSLTSFSLSPISSSSSSLSQKQYLPLHSCRCSSIAPVSTTTYEFSDGSAEVELRLKIGGLDIRSSRDISVDTHDTSLAIRVLRQGAPITLIETNPLFDRIKSSETIWYIDDDELVLSCKKQDPDLKWPDIMESWESLAAGSSQFLQGTSIYLVGDSTEINPGGRMSWLMVLTLRI